MEVTAFVTNTVPIRAACLLQLSPGFFKKAVPLPGVSLALVGCSTGSCTVVRLFSGTANRAGFLPGVVAGQVVPLVLVPVWLLYRQSRGP